MTNLEGFIKMTSNSWSITSTQTKERCISWKLTLALPKISLRSSMHHLLDQLLTLILLFLRRKKEFLLDNTANLSSGLLNVSNLPQFDLPLPPRVSLVPTPSFVFQEVKATSHIAKKLKHKIFKNAVYMSEIKRVEQCTRIRIEMRKRAMIALLCWSILLYTMWTWVIDVLVATYQIRAYNFKGVHLYKPTFSCQESRRLQQT